jgi:hypothetical protein
VSLHFENATKLRVSRTSFHRLFRGEPVDGLDVMIMRALSEYLDSAIVMPSAGYSTSNRSDRVFFIYLPAAAERAGILLLN